jgi:hypothetical protein
MPTAAAVIILPSGLLFDFEAICTFTVSKFYFLVFG